MNWFVSAVTTVVAIFLFITGSVSDRLYADRSAAEALATGICQTGTAVVQTCGSAYKIWPRDPRPGSGYQVINSQGKLVNCPTSNPNLLDSDCKINSCSPEDLCLSLPKE